MTFITNDHADGRLSLHKVIDNSSKAFVANDDDFVSLAGAERLDVSFAVDCIDA